jgi:TRAP-type C4-dicarboxylate transport system substrate-binding protein
LTLAVVALLPAVPAGAADWQLASGYKADLFHTENLVQFAREVEVATQGELKITVRPNNELFKMADIRDAVEHGKVEAGEVIMSSLVAQVPTAGLDSVPFIVGGYPDALRLWQHQKPVIAQSLARRGLVPLYAVPWPPQGLYSTKPVHALATDLKGSRMRTYNPTTVRIAELVGATPVDVSTADIGKALASGRIDSMLTSAVTGVDNKVWDQLKYFYDIKAWIPKNIVVVNKARLDALTPTQRAAVMMAAATAEERGWKASEAAAANALKELAAKGVKVDTATFQVRDEVRRHGDKFSLEWVRTTGKDASVILIPYYTSGNVK